MNNEVKELIEETEMIRDTFADDIFIHLLNRILDYINNSQEKINQLEEENKQLKANIDEAIELINKYRNKNYGSLEKKSFYCSKTDKLLSILERGKE